MYIFLYSSVSPNNSDFFRISLETSILINWNVCKSILLFDFIYLKAFPAGSNGKEFICNAGEPGSIPGLGERRKLLPTPVFLPGEVHGQRSLVINWKFVNLVTIWFYLLKNILRFKGISILLIFLKIVLLKYNLL